MRRFNTTNCTNCGKCCNFTACGHQPFITAADMRVWLDKGLWHIIKRVRFTMGKELDKLGEHPRQEWTFEHSDDKLGTCAFRINGKCAIYSVRPLACAVYPVQGTCIAKNVPKVTNKHLLRQFTAAHKEWSRSSDEWRQDKLKEILADAESRGYVGRRVVPVPLETIDQARNRAQN